MNRNTPLTLIALLALGCMTNGGSSDDVDDTGGDTGQPDEEADADTDADSDTDTDSDTDADTDSDTDADADCPSGEVHVRYRLPGASDLQLWIDPTVGSSAWGESNYLARSTTDHVAGCMSAASINGGGVVQVRIDNGTDWAAYNSGDCDEGSGDLVCTCAWQGQLSFDNIEQSVTPFGWETGNGTTSPDDGCDGGF